MKKCSECNHEQEKGNFCAACGGKMEELTEESNAEQEKESVTDSGRQEINAQDGESEESKDEEPKPASKTVEPDTVSVAGEASIPREPDHTAPRDNKDFQKVAGDYWGYVVQLIKNPAQAFGKKEDEFINGLFNILMYAVTFGMSVYFLISSSPLVKPVFSFILGEEKIPFFLVFSRVFIFILITIACTLISVIIFEKIFVKQMSFKKQLAQYGGLLTPFIGVHVLTILTGLAGVIGISIGLLLISLTISTYVYAGLFLFEKVSYYQTSIYKVYVSIGIVLTNILFIYLLFRVFIMQKLEEFEGLFDLPMM